MVHSHAPTGTSPNVKANRGKGGEAAPGDVLGEPAEKGHEQEEKCHLQQPNSNPTGSGAFDPCSLSGDSRVDAQLAPSPRKTVDSTHDTNGNKGDRDAADKALHRDPNGNGFANSHPSGKPDRVWDVVSGTPLKSPSKVKAAAIAVADVDPDAAASQVDVAEMETREVRGPAVPEKKETEIRPTMTKGWDACGDECGVRGAAFVKSGDNVEIVAESKDNGRKQTEEDSTVSIQQEQEQQQKQQQQQQQQTKRHTVVTTTEHTSGASQGRCVPVVHTSSVAAVTPANCTRPVTALSVYLVALYKKVNEAYCRQRRFEAPGPKFNNGFDDKEGHYLVLSGEEILNRYTVQEVLGKGSFGTVVRCYDEKRRENVALKITRHGLSFRTQAKLELDILLKLNVNPHLNQLVVKLLKVFDWQGHLVLVFELLSFNLYHLIKCTRYNGVTLDLVRKFAYQLVQVLYQLEQTKPSPIIHCDVKPENILLKNQNRSGIRLIDFGSACYSNKVIHKYIQSRYYRSPEVILYLEYGTAIDRWSLGCVLAELHTGVPLFDGRTEAAQLARFEAMLGPIPVDMLEVSPKLAKFYGATENGYKLKEQPLPRRSLECVLGVTTGGPRGSRKGTPGHSEESYRQFHDFLGGLLKYRPTERMSCSDALRHPFIEPLWISDQQQQQISRKPPPPPPNPPP
ncbi:serine/threonine protein kinase, putative,protein kinase, putative [Trypanosoma cruzi marinkellei]|uniref:Serine/threonine protein kinase, putative,protein kinase, putative n=1 Tax=Trypanosoma cruzi marinkellei TaxID=85056 RepID=K2NH29_TRYCR|nr:serine/threonine protein kinase, putative,protein kinase, putative [Trypanosoma cruzi marinkellei]